MNYTKLYSSDRSNYHFDADDLPNQCPRCNTVQQPKFVVAYRLNEKVMETLFLCNSKYCNGLFICKYFVTEGIYTDTGQLINSYPKNPERVNFQEEINTISPLFVDIYNESKEAEDRGLLHIAGMGYRKSLEFLIKDYLISFKEEDEKTIKELFLGKCIKGYLSDNIKQVAERATWLGNDETHYHRKWEDKDIKDLKILIDLTIHYISSEIQTKRYIDEMSK
ncbi:DUF4145 domain-containing protein [Salimicrobium humidisoli]|nr:DUF4145 domain-containing protein [Salimicrobium humidisoli]